MLGGVWLAYFSFGIVIGGIPPLIEPISEDLGLSRSAMGTLLGSWPLVYIVVSIPVGSLIDRFSLRSTIAFGTTLVALSGFLRAVAIDYPTMLVAVMVFGLGGPFISIGAPKLLSIWFDHEQRGRAMGIYLMAPAVGGMLVLAVSNSILMPLLDYSWRWTLVIVSGTAFISVLIWLCVAREDPGYTLMKNKSTRIILRNIPRTSNIKIYPTLMKNNSIRIILLLVLGMFLYHGAIGNWMPEILSDKGMSPSRASLLSAIPVAMGAIGTVIIPQIATPNRRRLMLSICFLVTGFASWVLAKAQGPLLLSALGLLGFSSRGLMPVIMLILIDTVGPGLTGAAGGLFFTFGEIGGVAGPVFLGLSSDLMGGFNNGIFLLSALCFFLGLLSMTLKPPAQNKFSKV